MGSTLRTSNKTQKKRKRQQWLWGSIKTHSSTPPALTREHRAGFGCAPASPALFSWQLFPLEHSLKSKTPCILSSYPGFEMNCVSPVSKLFSQSRSLSLSFPTERNQCFLEIWLIPGFGQYRHKKNLDYFFAPEKKKERNAKNDRVMKQRQSHKNQLKGVSSGEIWNGYCAVGNQGHT